METPNHGLVALDDRSSLLHTVLRLPLHWSIIMRFLITRTILGQCGGLPAIYKDGSNSVGHYQTQRDRFCGSAVLSQLAATSSNCTVAGAELSSHLNHSTQGFPFCLLHIEQSKGELQLYGVPQYNNSDLVVYQK